MNSPSPSEKFWRQHGLLKNILLYVGLIIALIFIFKFKTLILSEIFSKMCSSQNKHPILLPFN